MGMLLFLEVAGGHVSKGAERWIALGALKLQPSEFAKIGLLLALARCLSAKSVELAKPSSLLAPAALVVLPFALVLKQPDLGTALVMGGMVLPMLLWAGMPLFEIALLVSPLLSMLLSFHVLPWGIYFLSFCVLLYLARPSLAIASVSVLTNILFAGATAIIWNLLHDYQKSRIVSFLDPARDPFGTGYQIIQSKVAVGSGRFWGKGFLQGTQTKLSFLPEQHTDFIFSVFGEQFGFLGVLILILLFFLLVYRCFSVAKESRNRFINLLSVGIGSILGLHIFTNIAMTVGMMPVTGIPLPLLSYGGSFIFTCMILLGLIISARRGMTDF
jgi:rod shape determining protein RodA